MFTSYGKLIYNPTMGKRRNPWWALVECNDGMTYYYRDMVSKNRSFFTTSEEWLSANKLAQTPDSWIIKIPFASVVKPAWGSHISVIRGEQPPYPQFWEKYSGRKINFEYNAELIYTNGRHWWFTIICRELEDIRGELGLPPKPLFFNKNTNAFSELDFHLTFGRNIEVPSSKAYGED